MILGDAEIRARCQTGLVEPFNPSNLQTCQLRRLSRRAIFAPHAGSRNPARFCRSLHITADWLDPGFSGRITLEICNHGPQVLCLPLGTTIAQLVFYEVAGCQEGYCGRYQDQEQTTGAQL
jgi:deoxycytidine triphosphate deaminase